MSVQQVAGPLELCLYDTPPLVPVVSRPNYKAFDKLSRDNLIELLSSIQAEKIHARGRYFRTATKAAQFVRDTEGLLPYVGNHYLSVGDMYHSGRRKDTVTKAIAPLKEDLEASLKDCRSDETLDASSFHLQSGSYLIQLREFSRQLREVELDDELNDFSEMQERYQYLLSFGKELRDRAFQCLNEVEEDLLTESEEGLVDTQDNLIGSMHRLFCLLQSMHAAMRRVELHQSLMVPMGELHHRVKEFDERLQNMVSAKKPNYDRLASKQDSVEREFRELAELGSVYKQEVEAAVQRMDTAITLLSDRRKLARHADCIILNSPESRDELVKELNEEFSRTLACLQKLRTELVALWTPLKEDLSRTLPGRVNHLLNGIQWKDLGKITWTVARNYTEYVTAPF